MRNVAGTRQTRCRVRLTKITVIGNGYAGLVSGARLAEMGNAVLCFEATPTALKAPFVTDGRNIDPHEPPRASGPEYLVIGRR